MKPCPRNRQLIVWMSLDALDAPSARRLQAHLETCPGCRQYGQEVAAIRRDHAHAAAALPEVATDEFFHERLQQRIAAEVEQPVLGRKWEAIVRRIAWPWRPSVAVAISAVIVVIGFAWFWMSRPDLTGPPIEVVTATPPDGSLAAESRSPTLAHYRAVANTSLDDFDELLTRRAARQSSFPGEPAYSALRRSEPED